MEQQILIPHLFRNEFSKISAVLCKSFGMEHMEAAEDIASDTFLAALESWTYQGLPPNPTAWLYAVAKNKARNYIQRRKHFQQKIKPDLESHPLVHDDLTVDMSEQNISDSQLQMLFAICHPAIPAEAQIGLSLRILCGFGIDEIASAFLTNKETINKRLFRARAKLRQARVEIAMPSLADIKDRLDTVIRTLYLLFSEGYYSESQDVVLREDLCWEAMRLTRQLIENPSTRQPNISALYALMCFHASRFKARRDQQGAMVLYEDQDQRLWDDSLIAEGAIHLSQAAQGNDLSKYHLEASIAYWHTIKTDTAEKWENILQLYNLLLQLEYSPIAALNRTYALARAKGKAIAIVEAEKLPLRDNHYFYLLLGELYLETNPPQARLNWGIALELARTAADKASIQRKLDGISSPAMSDPDLPH